MLLKQRISDARGSKHLECFSRKNHLFSTRWTCSKKPTTLWSAKFGFKSKRLACSTRFFLLLCLWDKWSPTQSTQPTSRPTLSQLPSKKSSTLTVFPDTRKSTLLCTPFRFSPSCSGWCSETWAMEAACLLPAFGCWEAKLLKRCCLMFTRWGTWFLWWDFSHFMQAGFTTNSLPFHWMCLEVVITRPQLKNLLKRQKTAFILLDLIQNGSDHQTSSTISTHSRWNSLLSLVCSKWVLVLLF